MTHTRDEENAEIERDTLSPCLYMLPLTSRAHTYTQTHTHTRRDSMSPKEATRRDSYLFQRLSPHLAVSSPPPSARLPLSSSPQCCFCARRTHSPPPPPASSPMRRARPSQRRAAPRALSPPRLPCSLSSSHPLLYVSLSLSLSFPFFDAKL